MVRVLHLVEHLYQGGIERLLEQLARHTPESEQSLYFFTYHTPKLAGIGAELASHGHPVFCYDKGKGYDFRLLRELTRVIEQEKIDVLHTHDFGPTEYAVALKIRFPRLKLVHTHHTVHDFLSKRKYVLFFQLASFFYSKIIGVSDYVTGVLKNVCPLTRCKFVTVPNGLDVKSFEMDRAHGVEKLRLVNVSRVSREKNLIHLLKTCAQLKGAGVPFELIHVGSGRPEEQSVIHRFVRDNDLADCVRFAGFRSDVRPFLGRSDIFVSPSLTEGHPVAVLEAMAAGLLCLCSDIPAHRLLSDDGILYFPLDETSLFQLLQNIHVNPARYREVAARGRTQVGERFSLERMIASYGRVYA